MVKSWVTKGLEQDGEGSGSLDQGAMAWNIPVDQQAKAGKIGLG